MRPDDDPLTPALQPADLPDRALRPRAFADYVGQKAVLDNLQVFIAAAKKRGEALDHMLFSGPPGLGKTTLANIIANEMRANLVVTSGPAVEKKGDLAGILTGLQEGDVLFIDEIHRLSAVVEENLYPAMEDFRFDIVVGDGPHARTVKLPLPRFTLLGATTRTGLLTGPLRDRFGYVARLNFYSPAELTVVLRRSAQLLGIQLDPEGAAEIAARSRGTPRIANRLLRRLRDFADVSGDARISRAVAENALAALEIDKAGFDPMDRAYLHKLTHLFGGGPVGVETMAAALGEQRDTLEDVYEPYLVQQGYIARTPRGRVALAAAWLHLGLSVPQKKDDDGQGSLF